MTVIQLLKSKWWRTPLAALFIATPGVLLGQGGTVRGTIVAQGSQRPLAGVEVGVAGASGKGALTDGTGRFKLTDLSGSTVVLNVRFLGYRPVVDTVPVGNSDVRIELVERVPAAGSPYLHGGVCCATVCLPVPDIERDNNPSIVRSQIISGVRGEFTVP